MTTLAGKAEGRKDKISGKGSRSDLYRALFPIYYIGKACGLVPVTFLEQATVAGYQIRSSLLDVAYSACLLVALLGSAIWGLWRDLKDGWEHSTRLKSRTAVIATSSDVLGVMSLTCVSILGSFFRWKHLRIVIDRLIEIDEKVGVVSPKKTRRFGIVLATCSLTYLWLSAILDICAWDRDTKASNKMTDKGPVNYVPMYFMYTVIVSMELQYCVFAYNVGQRLFRLNEALAKISRTGRIGEYFRKDLGLVGGDPRGPLVGHGSLIVQRQNSAYLRSLRDSTESQMYAEGIAELIMVHASLCDTVSLINDAFGIAVLAVTLTCLLHLIITPYFLILQAVADHEWMFLVVQGMWCIFHVIRMLFVVQPTYATVTEGKRTAILVSRLLSSNLGIESRKELEIFSLQLLHRPLEFSACGLFTLDRTLVTSVAGAVTTYLVILLQFQSADDTKGEVDIIKNATQILKNASSLQNFTTFKIST